MKRSLFFSTLALILCFAMLLGTTWAWFTDSVESGVNQIIAGNLDVELTHTSKNVSDETVSGTTQLFKDVTLWEPGAYSYETFTVENVGNLALKYQMAINVGAFTSYEGHNLTEVLKVATTTSAPASREAAAALSYTALKDWSLDSADKALESGASETVTVVIYWAPTDNDNLYNMNNGKTDKALTVDLGVQLVATQYMKESDSFGPDYDEYATNSIVTPLPAEDIIVPVEKNEDDTLKNEVTIKNSSETASITAPAGTKLEATADTLGFKLAPKANVEAGVTITDPTEESSVCYNITVEGLADDNTVPLTATIHLKQGLTDVKAFHNGVAMNPTDYIYDPATGDVTVTSTSFSPFDFVCKDGKTRIHNAAELQTFTENVNGGKNYSGMTVLLENDIDLAGIEWRSMNGFGGIFDGQNHKISNMSIVDNGSNYAAFFATFGGTVKNVTFEKASVTGNRAAIVVEWTTGGPVVVENVKVLNSVVNGEQKNGGIIGFASGRQNGGCTNVTVNNCTVDGLTFKNDTTGERAWQSGAMIGYVYPEQNLTVTGNTVKNVTIENDPARSYPGTPLYASHPLIGVLSVKNSSSYTITIGNNTVSNCTGFAKGNTTTEYCGGHDEYNEASAVVIYNGSKQIEVKSDNFAAVIANANDGDTFILQASEKAYAMPTNVGKAISFVGNGDETVLSIASNAKITGDASFENLTIATNDTSSTDGALSISGGASFKDVTIAPDTQGSAPRYAVVVSGTKEVTFENVTFGMGGKSRGIMVWGGSPTIYVKNCTFDCTYPFNVDGGSPNFIVTNSTLNGWTSYTTTAKASFTNCQFGKSTSGYAYARPYSNASFTNCEFCSDFLADFGADGVVLTFNNCTQNGAALTTSIVNPEDLNASGKLVIDGVETSFNK